MTTNYNDVSNFSAKQNVADQLDSTVLRPAGTDSALNGANVLAPAFATGVASQLSDTGRDYMVYLTVGTAGTITVALGPTSTPAHTIVSAATATSGELVSFRLPAGWFVQVTLATATIATQTAISC